MAAVTGVTWQAKAKTDPGTIRQNEHVVKLRPRCGAVICARQTVSPCRFIACEQFYNR